MVVDSQFLIHRRDSRNQRQTNSLPPSRAVYPRNLYYQHIPGNHLEALIAAPFHRPSRYLAQHQLEDQDLLCMASDQHLIPQVVQRRETTMKCKVITSAAVHFWMIQMSRFCHLYLTLDRMLGVVLRPLARQAGLASLQLHLAV